MVTIWGTVLGLSLLGKTKWVIVVQSCLTLCNLMDCSLPGSSVHGILQARLLEWVAIFFSRGSSQPRDPALQESLYHLSHQGSLLLRHISKYEDRLKKYQQKHAWLYLIIYRQYSRICNESIRLFQKNTQDRREDKIQPLTGGRGNNLTNILFWFIPECSQNKI